MAEAQENGEEFTEEPPVVALQEPALPSVEEIVKCATRAVDLNNDEEVAMMAWHWLNVLSKNGGASLWHKDDYKYGKLPSKVTYKFEDNDKDFQLFPPAAEAFLVCVWENCCTKWTAMWDYKKQHGSKAKLPKRGKENKDNPMHKTLFTVSDKGQQKCGGWNREGKARFMTLTRQISESRKATIQVDIVDPVSGAVSETKTEDNTTYIEKAILENLRNSVGKDEEDAKQPKKRKREVDEDEIDVPLDLEED